MGKQKKTQRYVYKIHSTRLKKSGWNLTLSLEQARTNKELISLGENQLIRFIDELNGLNDPEQQIASIRREIRTVKKTKNKNARSQLKKLYERLDTYQFKKDYVCVIIDTISDYQKMFRNGFQINGITYCRLLGTVNGVKSNTIVFVNKALYPELKKRIDNGRNPEKEFIPAKLEAYYSLVCSSSIPVSPPKGVAVVHDCITHFKSDIIELDDTSLKEPRMTFRQDAEIELNDSDGYGLAMPELMQRWGKETGENYLLPGCVIRNSFCKGAVFPIDFQAFAAEHKKDTITDVWGETHRITDIELILTESMLKLWDSYSSIGDYMGNCMANHYTFAITKTSKEFLENERTMNYQFLQSYHFTDEQIDQLIQPTIDEISDILERDYRKSILYAGGCDLTEETFCQSDASFVKAIMIDKRMLHDPYVRKQLHKMIQKRIDDAKVGVISVPANYSFVSGDPYSLCQSMFGMEVTGLLKAGQVYSSYWIQKGIKKIVSFRAPMTSHNNIRVLDVVHDKKMDAFYRYMTTPTIFNSWDTCADAMNGFDKDGDCVMNTSLPLLVENTKPLPAIVCVQRRATKCIPSEADLMQADINSFGNAIGEITNQITSMFEQQAKYTPGEEEYERLDYRIKCGQLYQQNAIDKTKGIDSKPMPKEWRSKRKPYFMKYIYASEKRKQETYEKKNNEKCLMRFRIPLATLLEQKNHSEEERIFLENYHKNLPLGMSPCTVNKICWKIEHAFDDFRPEANDTTFDYSILKSDVTYTRQLFARIKKLYEAYRKEVSTFVQLTKKERIRPEECRRQKALMKDTFQRLCSLECPDEHMLSNIVLDLCYSKPSSRQFAWDMCGSTFIHNLLEQNNFRFECPVRDPDGDISFRGENFRMQSIQITKGEQHADDIE